MEPPFLYSNAQIKGDDDVVSQDVTTNLRRELAARTVWQDYLDAHSTLPAGVPKEPPEDERYWDFISHPEILGLLEDWLHQLNHPEPQTTKPKGAISCAFLRLLQ